MSVPLPQNADSALESWKYIPLKPPGNSRELFLLLRSLDPAEGVSGLLDRIDFSATGLAEIYFSVLDRMPTAAEHAAPPEGADLRGIFHGCLASTEFQGDIISLFLRAFPEKRRIVFVHVPKCAGTDLRAKLIPRYATLAHSMTSRGWTTAEKLLAALSGLSRTLDSVDEICVYGHLSLEQYIRRTRVRPSDHIFTIVRDPIDLMISQANYNVGLLASDPEGRRHDTRTIMSQLGLDKLPSPLPRPVLHELALRILRNEQLVRANTICRHLGNGTAAKALENLVSGNVEVTDVARYKQWLRERWNIESESRHNRSMTILTRDDVAEHADYLNERAVEDKILFTRISQALERNGKSSLRGAELI
jgi:hypothetical protein